MIKNKYIQAICMAVFGCTLIVPVSADTIDSVTQYSYDGLERVTCKIEGMNPGAFTSLPTDACTLGGAGYFGSDRITKTIYDGASHVLEIRKAVGTPIEQSYARFTYSPNGLKITEKDANGNLTTLEYDGYDRLIKQRYPNTASGAGSSSTTDYEQYSYDNNDNRTAWRRRDGVYIYTAYDNRNREIQRNTPNDPAKPQSMVPGIFTNYDPLGRLESKRFNGSAAGNPGITYTYDGLGRLKSATDLNGKIVSYDYNQSSIRTRLTYPDGQFQSYTLDALNRPTFTGIGSANIALSYNLMGNLTSITRGNGGSTNKIYDNFGRPISYSNDLAGASYDVTWAFGYNPASQLTSMTTSSAVYDYKEKVTSTDNKTYDGLNRDSSIVGAGGYDGRGNLISDSGRNFAYDIYNQLVSASASSSSLKLVYDPEGRLAKYSTNGGSTYTTFLYDGFNLIAEYQASPYASPSSTMTRRYLHGVGTNQPLIQFNGADVNNLGLIRYLYTNYQGSVVALADNNGNKIELYKYGPYGEPTNENSDSSWAGESRFRYTGQYALPEMRLYYYKARMYDPTRGRFLQTDPIGYADDYNLYAYVGNDPLNRHDPTGMQAECAHGDNCMPPKEPPSPCICQIGNILGQIVKGAIEGTTLHNESTESSSGDNLPSVDEGTSEPSSDNLPKSPESRGSTQHGEERAQEAQTNPNRQVGDGNKVIENGKTFTDTETGNTVHVDGNRVVIVNENGVRVTQFKNTRANTLDRISSGKWEPK